MTNIKDISDGPLNRLQSEVTTTIIELRQYYIKEAPTYRLSLDKDESDLYTFTLIYTNSLLTSALAKLYMLLGYTKGEITIKELNKHLKDINKDMLNSENYNFYTRHNRLTRFIIKAEELNDRIDSMAHGGLYYDESD